MGFGTRIARVFFVVLPVLLCLLLQVEPAAAAQRQLNGLIVKLKPGLSSTEQAKVFAAHGGTKKLRLQRLKLDVVNLPSGELEKAFAKFKADPRVESVEVDNLRSAAGVPNDSSYSSQWALPKIGWDKVFGVTNPTGSATVAILDAGIDASHPDLAGKVISGTSILDGSDGRTDASGHGTMLAGIIAAAADNGIGIAGVAPAGVKVMPVTVLDSAGTGLDSNIITGIVWAADHGADVILMPFSNPTFSQALQEAIDYAWSKGAVLIAATGNGGLATPTFPAGDRGVVGVAATSQDNTLYSGSNHGPDTFVVAPGVAIYSTTRGGSYGDITGTSASAAVVAGIASYMKAVDPTLTNGLIVSRLGQSADQTAAGLPGYGLVNLADALGNVDMTPLQPAGVGTSEPFQDPYVAAGACDKLRITTNPQTLTVGVVSGTIRVAAHNGNFNCQLSAGMNVVSLTSNSSNYKFYSDAAGTTEITQVTLVEGPRFDEMNNTTHDANIYYKDMNAGSPTITANLPGLLNPTVTQTETVNPAPQTITFTSTAPASAQVDGPTYIPVATGGGSGNPVVFTIAPASSSVCTIASGVVSFRTAGTCVINANQAGNANYIVAPQVQQSFTVGKGNQAAVTVTATPSTVIYGNTAALSASGGSGTGSYSFSSGNSTGCSVTGSTLTVTNASGDCSVTATRATDINYLAATSVPVPVTLVKASQGTVNVTAPLSATFGQQGLIISASGGSGTGAFSYSANNSDACSVDAASGALTITSATGSCSVSATRVADDNYQAATSVQKSIALVKSAQSTVTVLMPPSAYFGQSGLYVSASGGSGSGSYSYLASGTACQVDSSTGLLTITSGSGSCSVTATKAGDNDYNSATSAVASIPISKALQSPLVAVITPSSVTYGGSASLSTQGGSGGGAVSFTASGTGCQLNGTTLTVVSASGSCSVTAVKAEDVNYQAATSAPVAATLNKAEQAAVFISAPTSARYGETGLSAIASGGSSSGNYSYLASGACSVNASTGALTFSSVPGSCSVTATKPGDDNYNAATSAAAIINVNKAVQPAISAVATPSTVSFGSTAALTISGGAGDGAVSFTASGAGCEVSGSTLSVLNASQSCSVTATKASDALYEAAVSPPTVVALAKASQQAVAVSVPASVVYRQSGVSATASGGSGNGSYGYSATGACSVNATSGALSFNSGIGNCSVTATKVSDDNYSAASSAAATITVVKAPQSTLSAVVTPATVSFGSSATLTTSGGDGSGKVTFSAGGSGCAVNGSTLTVLNASGSCSVTAAKEADATYEAATSLPVSVTLAKTDQTTVSVSAPVTAHYGETGLAATASGGNSSANYLYSASGACLVNASTGALTFSNATGTCSVTATKPADDNYNAATSAAAIINVNKAAQPQLSLSVTPSTVVFGSTASVATSGGAGDGAVSYQVTGTGCQVVGTTLSVLNASATCSVTASKASDLNYEATTSQSVSVTLTKASQSSVSISAPLSAVYNQGGLSAQASGGSGTGGYSYGATGACSVNATSGALSFNSTGTCSVTATRASDDNYSAATSAVATITVSKASQFTLTAIVTPSPVSFGSTADLSTSGGNGGGLVTYSAIGDGCQVAGSVLSVTNASGSCSVTASKAADAYYTAATSLPVSVPLVKADQTTVSVSAPATAHYGDAGLAATASGGDSSASYVYSATGACSINASTGALTFGNATGSCSVTATKPADLNYNAATSAAAVINVNKAAQPQLTLSVTPSTVVFGSTASLATSGGAGDGDVSYQVTGTGCQIVGTTLSVLNASATCSITATKASDLNYEAATSQTVSVTLNKAQQSTVSLSAPVSAVYGQSGLTAAASGGSGTGSYSYNATGACSVNAATGALSFNSTGTCSVTATRASDDNYSAASSTAATITVSKATQSTLTAIVNPSPVSFGSTANLSTSGGNGGGLVTYSASGDGCQVAGSVLSVTNASGSCSVSAAKGSDLNYEAATSLPVSVTLAKANQATVSVSAPANAHYGETGLTATATGGSSSANYVYSATGACSVDASSGVLTFSNATGICSVTATKPSDDNYNPATSVAATINVNKAAQPALTLTVTPSTVTFGSTAAVSTSGGAGDGGVTYQVTGTGCQVVGTALSVVNASQNCSVTATKASDANYEPATSNTVTVTLQQAAQQNFAVSAPTTAYFNQQGVLASATGGNGSGSVSYSAAGSTACSVNATSGAVTITSGTGECVITATKAADSNYSSASAQATIAVNKAAQLTLTASVNPASVPYGTTAALTSSGGSGGGTVNFSATGGGCSVSGTTLTVLGAGGNCSVTATRSGDNNYLAATSAAVPVTLSKGTQQAVTVTVPASAILGETGLYARASGGSGTDSYRYDSTGSTACSVDTVTGALTIATTIGSCSITAIRLGDSNYNDSARSAAAVIAVGKADQAPLTVDVSRTVAYGTTATLNSTGGSGTGAVTFSATGTGCSVSDKVLSVLAAGGSCSVTATKAADDLYKPATSAPVSITLVKGAQAQVTLSVPATARYQQSGLFAVAAGGTVGSYSYAATGSCSVNISSGALTINAASGICSVTATRSGDGNYNPESSVAATLTATKGMQRTVVATATPASVTYGSTAILSATGGDGIGSVSYDAGASTGCTVSGTTLSVTDASGSCSVTATKAGDATWEPATSAAVTVRLSKATQAAVTVTAPPTARLYQTGLSASASGGSTTGAISYSAGESTACSVDAATGALTITLPSGSCSITATRAGDGNYLDASSTSVNVAVNKAVQSAVTAVVTPAAVTYGGSALLTATGGNGSGTVSFSVGSSTGCSIQNGTTLTVTKASGNCSVTATKAGDIEYDDATSAATSVTLNKAPQEVVTVSAPGSASFNQANLFARASGGSSSGSYIYSAGSSNACTVNSSNGALTITSGTGSCVITATKGSDDNYLVSAASAAASITINKAEQNMLSVSAPGTLAFGSTAKLTVVGGSTGTVSYSAGSSTGCKVTGDLLSVTSAGGTCFLTATRAADPNFNATTSSPVEVKLEKGAQGIVSVAAPASAAYAQSGVVARASGGNGTAVYSYSAGSSSACSVEAASGVVTITASTGTCAITATRGGDANYLESAESAPANITVSKGTQPTLTAVVQPSNVAYGSSAQLSTSGGAGDGVVTFSVVNSSPGCEIQGETLSVTNPGGSCFIQATKGASSNYNAATSPVFSVALSKGTQAAVLLTAPASARFGETGLKAVASAGSGSGAYSYSASGSTACTVDASGNITITTGTGSCAITATRAGDTYYFASAASTPATITVTKAQQSISFASLDTKTYGAADFSVSASSSSKLPVSYSSDNATVATVTPQGVIKVTGQGTAVITASQPGDLNYAAAESVQQTLTVDRAVLTVKANDASRSYGAADPVFSATFTGFVNGESDASALKGAPAFSTDAETWSPVGSFRIVPAQGTLQADNYSFTFQEGVLAIGLANQTITFNPLQPRSYGAASFDLDFTPGASGNPVTFTSSDPSVATVSGRTVTIKRAGSTQIVAAQTGTSNYAAATAQQTLTVNKAQLFVTAENKARPYNSANPEFTYKYSGFVNGDDASAVIGAPDLATDAVLSSAVGNYDITVAKGTLDAANYSFTLVNGVLAVGKASQNIVFDQLPAKTYGDLSFTLSAQGGPSGNPVTFTSSNTLVATISGNTVNIVGAGGATITASQSGNGNYAPASAQQPLNVAKASLTVRANDTSRRYNSANPSFTVSYDGFVRNDTATTSGVLSGAPAVTSIANSNSVPGSYPIVPAVGNLFSTKYEFSYQNGTLTVTKGLQDKVTVTAPTSASYAQAGVSVAAGAGSGTGSFSYQTTTDSTACRFPDATVGLLSITSGTGTCAVTAIRAGDDLYEASAASAPVPITITRANQAAVTVTAPSTLSYGASATLTGAGGSGSGNITFSAGSSTGCQVTGNVLTVTNASGSCSVQAVRAADGNYNSATSAATAVTLQKAGQGVVTVSVPARATYGQQGVTATATGGTGTGAYSYSAGSSTACSVNAASGAISVLSATGTCAITATRSADNNYNPSAASAPATLAIDKANQAVLTVATPSSLMYGNSWRLYANGGSGSGAVTFSAGSSTGCAVSENLLSVTDASSGCTVSATKAGDDNHNATTSAAVAVQLARAVPVLSWSNPKTIVVGTALSATQLNATANTAGGTFVYTPPAGTLLPIGTKQLLTVSYTPGDSRNYTGATKSVLINVDSATKPIAIDGPPTGTYENMKSGKNFIITRTQPGTGAATTVGSTTSTIFTDNSDLKPNTIYQYSVASDTDPSKTVFMTVRTPLGSGWNIVAVPYDTAGVPVSAFFADKVSTIYQWVPTGAPLNESSDTHYGSYVPVNNLVPGMGYFARPYSRSTMLTYSAEESPETATVTLKPGWTMIANPSLANKTNIAENWLVDGVPLYLLIQAGKIGGSVYWWNGVTYESWSIMQNNPQIEPWKGYWILNLDDREHSLTIN